MSNIGKNKFLSSGAGLDNKLVIAGSMDIESTSTFEIEGTQVVTSGLADKLNNLEAGTAVTGITALVAGGQTGATALTGEYNDVTTVASAFDSVKLPTAVSGLKIKVKNSGASILSVFPFLADSINGLAVNLSVDIPIGGEMIFNAISTTVWETVETLYVSSPTTQTGGLAIKATANAGNTDITITNDSHGQATTVTIPDSGLATSYVGQSTAALTVAEMDILDGATVTTTELNRLDDSAEVESVAAAGAASVTKFITNLNVASGGAVTLAACPATMIGKIKTIRMATDDGDVTIALTEIQGGTAATTATFDDVSEELILIGSAGGKWTVVKEFGVTLS